MNVVWECQSGDEIVCVQEFHATPEGQSFSWDTCRRFRIGERVRFQSARFDASRMDQPNAWKITFLSKDGQHWDAVPAYFATTGTWKGIKKYLARFLVKETRK